MKQTSCVACGTPTPDGKSAHTLLGAPHRWRLVRRAAPEGGHVLDWYCRTCWQKRKRADGEDHLADASAAAEAGKKFDSALAALKQRPPSKPTR
jgi:hypothetical protein